jgi:hypothetical protein
MSPGVPKDREPTTYAETETTQSEIDPEIET